MSTHALIELLRGQGAHVDPLACIEDLPWDLAGRRVAGFPHSIADLVFHMNYWMDYELCRIRGQKPGYPDHNSESFPAPPSHLDVVLWNELRQRFAGLLSAFAVLANSPEALQRQIVSVHESDRKVAGTLQAVITQIVAHNSYHAGQIALLRRVLNAWPPPAGGDTW